MGPTIQVNVRVKSDVLLSLDKLGEAIQPKPLNRSEMINVAVREYVERHALKTKGKSADRTR